MESNRRVFVDVHVIQTVPPSCINRDDTGSPKTAVYGGATRARVSSQSWKRAMRLQFRDMFPNDKIGVRTKKIVKMVSDEINKIYPTADSENLAVNILKTAGLSIKSVEKGTNALFFLSVTQAKELARLAIEDPETTKEKPSAEVKKRVQDALRQYPGIDVALFGRMVADNPLFNTDACAQVAHSISTHKVSNEYDYFTAVDDLAPEDNVGAGHIDTIEFNSSTLYRYATVAVHELYGLLESETADVVRKFVQSFACSMPSGKQNTFANRTLPDAVMVTVRNDQPINLVGAFEKPVPATDDGYVTPSINRLIAHAKSVYKDFAGEPQLTLLTGDLLSPLGNVQPLNELLNTLEDEINKYLPIGGNTQ